MAATGSPVRRILLADADAFYVSVARLIDPDGVGREPLVIVGGTADGRGVVTSASYECRAYGVHSAMPTAQALRLCPDAVVVPVPRGVCVEKSLQIQDVLRDFTPIVEPASIDEFYLDLTGTEGLYADEALDDTAVRIRHRVLEQTGLGVAIGGGTSRLIAKVAARLAKPRPDRGGRGVHIVPAGDEGRFMQQFDLAAIPMIGPRFQERLGRYGLRTVNDVLPLDRGTLNQWFGTRTGTWLYRRVRGLDSGIVADGPRRRSISHEETFPRDLSSDQDLERELLRLTVSLAQDLRRKGRRARTVTVKLRDNDFTTRQASVTLPEAVDTERVLLETARALLARLRRARRRPARLIGVAASQLARLEDTEQLGLFGDAGHLESPRDHALAKVVDGIAERFGRRSIRRGTELQPREPSS